MFGIGGAVWAVCLAPSYVLRVGAGWSCGVGRLLLGKAKKQQALKQRVQKGLAGASWGIFFPANVNRVDAVSPAVRGQVGLLVVSCPFAPPCY